MISITCLQNLSKCWLEKEEVNNLMPGSLWPCRFLVTLSVPRDLIGSLWPNRFRVKTLVFLQLCRRRSLGKQRRSWKKKTDMSLVYFNSLCVFWGPKWSQKSRSIGFCIIWQLGGSCTGKRLTEHGNDLSARQAHSRKVMFSTFCVCIVAHNVWHWSLGGNIEAAIGAF